MREALLGLRRNPGRSVLTVLGIGLATGLVVLLLALSAGIESSASRLAVASGVDLLATSANTSLQQGTFPPITGAHQIPSHFAAADSNVATSSPWLVGDLVFANSSLYAASNVSSNGSGVPAGWGPTGAGAVGWIPGENAGLEVPTIYAGPGFPVSNDPHYANGSYSGPPTHAIVLDGGLAGVLHVGVGDLVWANAATPSGPPMLSGWFANATPFRVAGLSGPFWLIPSALLGFLYLSEMQGLTGGNTSSTDYASLVLVHLKDASTAPHDQALLTRAFPSLTIFTLGNVLSAVRDAVDLYRTFGALIGVIGVVVATLFTSTVLLMSVEDRRREIAVVRALGFGRTTVALRVFEESAWFGLFGLSIGLAVGLLGAYAVGQFLSGLLPGLPMGFSFVSFDPGVLASGIVEVSLVSIAAAIVPAGRAMNLPVASELRAP